MVKSVQSCHKIFDLFSSIKTCRYCRCCCLQTIAINKSNSSWLFACLVAAFSSNYEWFVEIHFFSSKCTFKLLFHLNASSLKKNASSTFIVDEMLLSCKICKHTSLKSCELRLLQTSFWTFVTWNKLWNFSSENSFSFNYLLKSFNEIFLLLFWHPKGIKITISIFHIWCLFLSLLKWTLFDNH